MIALVALTHNEFKCSKCLIHRLFLIYKDSIERSSLFKKSRKCLPLKLNAWKIICQLLIIFLHLFFLSKSYDVLYENNSMRRSTSDVSIALMHFIHLGWVKQTMTSTLVFDIAQFFPSLNHWLFSLILKKTGFDLKVVHLFSNYLVGSKTWYFWNSFSSSFFNGSILSPILLSALYLAPVPYILEKHLKILKIPVSILSFVDDGLLIAQSKSLTILNNFLFCSYRVTASLLKKFSLILKHDKIEMFHFSRSTGMFNPSSLNLSDLRSSILCFKNKWKYLGFYFNRKLFFYHHINYYANKVISTIKCMKILGNLTCDLISYQKLHSFYHFLWLPTLVLQQVWGWISLFLYQPMCESAIYYNLDNPRIWCSLMDVCWRITKGLWK